MKERRKQFTEELDGQLPTREQMRLLSRLAYRAFVDIRARTQDPNLVFALADALHNLPVVMYEPSFKWSWVLMFLEDLERAYPEVASRYLAEFDEVIGFRAD